MIKTRFEINYYSNSELANLNEDLAGSIAITVDTDISTRIHKLIRLGQIFSSKLGNVSSQEQVPHELIFHALVIVEKGDTKFTIIDTQKHGAQKVDFPFNSPDSTGLLVITPTNREVRTQILSNAHLELKPLEKNKKTAPFDVKGSVIASFIKSDFYKSSPKYSHKRVRKVAKFLADYLKGQNPQDKHEKPKPAVCSALVTRIVQGSLLMACLETSEQKAYAALPKKTLVKAIQERLKNEHDPLAQTFANNPIFRLNYRWTLPYQLFDACYEEKAA